MNCQSHLNRNADPKTARPPLVHATVRRRARGRGARAALGRGRVRRRRPPAGQPARAEEPALRAEGEAGDLPVHGRGAEPPGAVRQQARARPARRHPAARPTCSRATARRSSTRTRSCSARSSSSPGTGSRGPSCPSCCPHLAGVADEIAIVKSMTTDAFNHAPAQILMSTGSTQFGRPSLGTWATYGLGQRVARPPRVRRLQHGQEGPQRGQLELGERVPADRPPGGPVPQQRRPRPVPLEPARDRRRRPARLARHPRPAQPDAARRRRRPRDRHPDQLVRDGLPDAVGRPRGHGHRPRAEARPRPVRRRAGQAVVRQHLRPGPPAGRARASGSSRSSTRPGTSTATSSTTSRPTAATPTRPAPP